MAVDSNRLRVVPVTIEFGKPLDFTGRFDGVPLGRARREATDEIMAAIQAITGQEQAGVYNEAGGRGVAQLAIATKLHQPKSRPTAPSTP